MKPVMQTKRGGPNASPEERGDCWSACLASLLEVPIEDVPIPHTDEHWWDATQRALAPHGFEAMEATGGVVYPSGYWIATVPSLNLGEYDDGRKVMHCVVMRGGEVVHDPSIGERRYEAGTSLEALEFHGCSVLVPLRIVSLRGSLGGDQPQREAA